MDCAACHKPAKVQHENRFYCNACYLDLIERRVRKYCRANDFFKKNDVIYVPDKLLAHLLVKVVQGMPIRLVHKRLNGSKRIVLWTMDDEIAHFFRAFFSNDFKKNLKPIQGIKFLRELTDDELSKYAKISKLKFNPNRKPSSYKFVQDILKKYPFTDYGISTTIHELQQVLR